MAADLVLILNLSEPIPSLRRVRSATELLTEDLPPFPAGATLSCELRLIDGNGAPYTDYLGATLTPRFLMWVPGPLGGMQLVLLSAAAFTEILETVDAVPNTRVGWTFDLPLTTQAIINYLANFSTARPVHVELSLVTAGSALKLLYLRAGTIMPRILAAVDSTVTATAPEHRSDITTAAQHRAVATLGHALPWIMVTLESDTWTTWTLRARTGADPSDSALSTTYADGALYRLPADASAVSNNVLWVRSPVA